MIPAKISRSPANAQVRDSKAVTAQPAHLGGTDERNWTGFEAAIRNMLPQEAATELLAHGRAQYFSARARQWRDALRENERSRRQGFGGKRRSIHSG